VNLAISGNVAHLPDAQPDQESKWLPYGDQMRQGRSRWRSGCSSMSSPASLAATAFVRAARGSWERLVEGIEERNAAVSVYAAPAKRR
jgi:hypothetical protein